MMDEQTIKEIKDIENCRLLIPHGFKLKKNVRVWNEHFTKKCLYVAKGPSAKFLGDYLDFGHIATVNEACTKIDKMIDYAFFFDRNALVNSQAAWEKIRTFVLPALVFGDGINDPPVCIEEIPNFPYHRAITFYHNQDLWDYNEVVKNVHNKRLVSVDTAVMGFHFLVLSGYNDFMLLGHDGGVGYVDGVPCVHPERNMQVFRDNMVNLIKALKSIYDIRVKFYDGGEL